MSKEMSDKAASHQPGGYQSHHGVVADQNRELGSQLPGVVVTAVLRQTHCLHEHAGYYQRTILACQTWNALYVARMVHLTATDQVACPEGLLHVWVEQRHLEVGAAVHLLSSQFGQLHQTLVAASFVAEHL